MLDTLRSATTAITYFEFCIPHSAETVSEKKGKNMGQTTAGTLEFIREVDKSCISKSEIAQAYGIPLSTLLLLLYQ